MAGVERPPVEAVRISNRAFRRKKQGLRFVEPRIVRVQPCRHRCERRVRSVGRCRRASFAANSLRGRENCPGRRSAGRNRRARRHATPARDTRPNKRRRHCRRDYVRRAAPARAARADREWHRDRRDSPGRNSPGSPIRFARIRANRAPRCATAAKDDRRETGKLRNSPACRAVRSAIARRPHSTSANDSVDHECPRRMKKKGGMSDSNAFSVRSFGRTVEKVLLLLRQTLDFLIEVEGTRSTFVGRTLRGRSWLRG